MSRLPCSFFFFLVELNWDLNSGTLLLDQWLHSIVFWLFWRWGSYDLFDLVGLDP
jgi:hypothetical protein